MNPICDFRRFVSYVARDPKAWLRWQIVSFGRSVFPTYRNNDFRKVTTTVLFGVWTLLTLGFGNPPDRMYIAITALVFMILGQQWELEKMRVGPFTVESGKSNEPANEPPTAPDDGER